MMAASVHAEVLVVDDEADILQAVATVLESELDAVEVATAPGGRQALEVLEQRRVALVLSDYRMPGMDGLEFLKEVHRRHPDMPTIMMTAYADWEVEQAAKQDAGVRLFLPKPLDVDALATTIGRLLGGRGPT